MTEIIFFEKPEILDRIAHIKEQAEKAAREQMTALKKYERLESLGLWRADKDAQHIEVIISFGDASLVLSDANSKPYAHWSLAALTRANPSQSPAIYHVDESGAETLEIDDQRMVTAIEEIRSAIERARPHPGRLRFLIGLSVFAAFVAGIVFWLPDAAARYATTIIPDSQAAQIGQSVLSKSSQITGSPCRSSTGDLALNKLMNKVIKVPANKVSIVDMGPRKSAHLPGGNILLSKSLLNDAAGLNVLAGYMLMERAAEDEISPLFGLFRRAGLPETLKFLATSKLNPSLLDQYSEQRLTQEESRPSVENLTALFEVAELSPFAFAKYEPAYEMLAEIDGFEDRTPLLTDGEWIALQGICD